MTRKRLGQYVKLSSGYATDEDVMEAGPDAELLFIRSLAFCAGKPEQDGFISHGQATRLLGLGLSRMGGRIAALLDTGLWVESEGGYQVRGWLKWNRSSNEIGMVRARDRDRKRDPKSERNGDGFRADSERIPSGTGGGFQRESRGIPCARSDTDTDTDTDAGKGRVE